MDPNLTRCLESLTRALAGLSASRAETSKDGRWSIAQIVEHLDLAYTRNTAGLELRVAKGAAPELRGTGKQAVARFVLVVLGYFPSGRQSPPAVVPQGRPFDDVRGGLEADLVALDRALAAAEQKFGATRPIVIHPIMGPFSVADWRRFHWVHTRHHVKQINERK
jgi:hypothetical protein